MLGDGPPQLVIPLVSLRASGRGRVRFQSPQLPGHDLAEGRVRKQQLVDQRRPQVGNGRREGGGALPFMPETNPRGDVGAFPEGVHSPMRLLVQRGLPRDRIGTGIANERAGTVPCEKQAFLGKPVVHVLNSIAGNAEYPLRIAGRRQSRTRPQALVQDRILELPEKMARDLSRSRRRHRDLELEEWLHRLIGPLSGWAPRLFRKLALNKRRGAGPTSDGLDLGGPARCVFYLLPLALRLRSASP